MAVITKELAIKIKKKLKAQVLGETKAHQIVGVFHKGKLILEFGIRRSSNKEKGHDHISGLLFVSTHQARSLGQCPMSRKEWLEIIEDKGLV